MGPTWVLSAPNGPHVGSVNLLSRLYSTLDIYVSFLATANFADISIELPNNWVLHELHCQLRWYLNWTTQ